jgi:pimeloyl-ACP methyl ester carboxylesterase
MNSHSYFFTPQLSNPEYPLLVFLPGMDETGKDLMRLQTAGLENAFDVRCFVIPPDELTTLDELAEEVISLTQVELKKVPRTCIYLCGESFGACIALKVMEKTPEIFTRFILINSASSFHRLPWLNLGALLFPYTPNFLYEISSFIALPFLASLNRLSSTAIKALSDAVNSAPKKTAEQRLFVMKEFRINERNLSYITQPVLLIGSKSDLLLPSKAEAERLAKLFPNCQLVILPYSGHACLIERDINFKEILQAENFLG